MSGSGGGVSEPIDDDAYAVGYDVSASDLATAPPTREAPAMSEFAAAADDSIAFGPQGLQEDPPEPVADAGATIRPSEGDELELGSARPTSSGDNRITDLSPLVEQRIQETLEKVAWEAFSDLSESIVKQVIGRIEQIAWEVIPQMAETLVREEIRKMKGEKD
jgi:hypothetical protein